MGPFRPNIVFCLFLGLLTFSGFQNCTGGFGVDSIEQQLPSEIVPNQQTSEAFFTLPDESAISIKTFYNMDNKSSSLTWGASYEMMAYLSRFRSTQDFNTLLEFIRYAQEVLNKTDRSLNFGSGADVWSQTNYTGGIPYPTVAGDGMISYPIADFATIVLAQSEEFQKRLIDIEGVKLSLKQIAVNYLDHAIRVIAFHDKEWNGFGGYIALPETAEYFKDPDGRSISTYMELPFNMTMALGRTMLKVYSFNKDQKLKIKLSGMIARWKEFRTYSSNGNVSWPYMTEMPTVPEDVTHGAIDVDFLRLAYEHGIDGIGSSDLRELGHSFRYTMSYSSGLVTYHVNGTTKWETIENHQQYPYRYLDTISWLSLAPYHDEVRKMAIDATRASTFPPGGGYLQWVRDLYTEHTKQKL